MKKYRLLSLVLAGMLLLVCAPGLFQQPAAALLPSFNRALVSLTFDDSWLSQYNNALPILNAHGVKGTMFTVTGWIGPDPTRMSLAQLQQFQAGGHEIASHTVDHPVLTSLTPTQLDAELADSKAWVVSNFGSCPDFASPYGDYDATTIAAIQQYYQSQRTVDVGYNSITNFSPYTLKVQNVLNTTTPADVAGWIAQAKATKTWLILVYHQVENPAPTYGVTPTDLIAHCQAIQDAGVPGVTVAQAMAELTPYFNHYTVTSSGVGNGTVSPASQILDYGSSAGTFFAPDPGYYLSAVSDNGVAQPVADPYVIDSVTADHAVTAQFSPMVPVIDSLSPDRGPPGTTVTLTGSNFLAAQGGSTMTFNGTRVDRYLSWSNDSVQVVVPPSAETGPVVLTTAGGVSNSDRLFTLTQNTWYLAEGSTNYGFDTFVTIQNPNDNWVNARVTYLTPGGPVSGGQIALPPASQTVVNPRDVLGNSDFSTKVECPELQTIAVDRRMSWTGPGAASGEGSSSVGVTSPALKWYLPEGSSAWNFECWLLVLNPNNQAATVSLTYMIEGVGPKVVAHTVGANSRATFSMSGDIGQADSSVMVESDIPVVPERSMYRNNRREGHVSIGTTEPANSYFVAEGSTGFGFTTYLLVQNPNDAAAAVTVMYMTTAGPVVEPAFTMRPQSRKTIQVNGILPGKDFSTLVTSDKAIVAERAMYWNNGTGEAMHDSIGTSHTHSRYFLPDGQTGGGYETWTLVQNPNDSPVGVRLTYMTPTGAGDQAVEDTIPALSRRTYTMAGRIPAGKASIEVESLTPGKRIIAERSMYWNNRGAGTNTIGAGAN